MKSPESTSDRSILTFGCSDCMINNRRKRKKWEFLFIQKGFESEDSVGFSHCMFKDILKKNSLPF